MNKRTESTPLRKLVQRQNFQIFRLKGALAGLRGLLTETRLPAKSTARAHLQLAMEFSAQAIESLKEEHEKERAELYQQLGKPEPKKTELKLPQAEE